MKNKIPFGTSTTKIGNCTIKNLRLRVRINQELDTHLKKLIEADAITDCDESITKMAKRKCRGVYVIYDFTAVYFEHDWNDFKEYFASFDAYIIYQWSHVMNLVNRALYLGKLEKLQSQYPWASCPGWSDSEEKAVSL